MTYLTWKFFVELKVWICQNLLTKIYGTYTDIAGQSYKYRVFHKFCYKLKHWIKPVRYPSKLIYFILFFDGNQILQSLFSGDSYSFQWIIEKIKNLIFYSKNTSLWISWLMTLVVKIVAKLLTHPISLRAQNPKKQLKYVWRH